MAILKQGIFYARHSLDGFRAGVLYGKVDARPFLTVMLSVWTKLALQINTSRDVGLSVAWLGILTSL